MVPCCWDAMSAKMIGQAGFPFTFMSGFAVSAARLGEPDLGLISYGEMVDQLRNICAATADPGDRRRRYRLRQRPQRRAHGERLRQAGAASVMIEDQVRPKRCGHTKGKLVVERPRRSTASRPRRHARDEMRKAGGDILILARTDARATARPRRGDLAGQRLPRRRRRHPVHRGAAAEAEMARMTARRRASTWPTWSRAARPRSSTSALATSATGWRSSR